MIDYNLVLYIGIGLIVFGFVLFLVSIHFEREAEIKLFKQEQLDKAFKKAQVKKWTKKEIIYVWNKCYGEDLTREYSGFISQLERTKENEQL